MAVACAAISASYPSHHFSPNPSRRPPPPISIFAGSSYVDPLQLRALLGAANHSCHRFPALSPDGRAPLADPDKLRVALAHSSVVVSVFCRLKFVAEYGSGARWDVVSSPSPLDMLLQRAVPASAQDRQLVGFGRAVSDGGLAASIHDVVVIPSLQRRGIGRKIVAQITRILTTRGIYDISALCSENESLMSTNDDEFFTNYVNMPFDAGLGIQSSLFLTFFFRLFFEACGFGEDRLGSTTMMYTRTPPDYKSNQVVRVAGRLQLLVPPGRELSSTILNSQSETIREE
ncbi:hypothetical protein ZIOFF_036928 [Zingiber officinale]|uniref:N-acetyltransferase domain-containing protein n=1 Tax=Zingiber officinale TaxID=94328 RepID=A0A8J5L317_ZINOF|nr:hypothetical protein ZIOFF_036928 [Zingiber officinale]